MTSGMPLRPDTSGAARTSTCASRTARLVVLADEELIVARPPALPDGCAQA